MDDLRKTAQEEVLPTAKIVVSSRVVVTWPELTVVLLLVVGGGVPLVLFWSYLSHQSFDLQQFAMVILLGIYIFAVVETFAIFLLWGFQRLVLPQATIHWLGGATIGEISVLLSIAYKFAFHSK